MLGTALAFARVEAPAALATVADAPRAQMVARGQFEAARRPIARMRVADVLEAPAVSMETPTVIAASAEPVAAALGTVEPTVAPSPAPTAAPTLRPTARPTPQPTPRPAAPAPVNVASLAAAEQRTLLLMNTSRAAAGLHAYVIDPAVSEVARRHSAAEAAVGYVYHDGPDGTAYSRNRPACGTGWWSENTGKVWNWNVDVLHREFMAEPWIPINHRTNIMDANFRRVGIGAVIGPDAMYLTVVFCR